MVHLRYFGRLVLLISILMLGACEDSDDTGPSPIPDSRDKFTGSWSVNNENCGKGKYVVTIGKDPSNSIQVIIQNFAFSSAMEPDTAIIAGNNISVFPQVNSEGWVIDGSGTYTDKGDIEWTYSLLISGTIENCTATYTKN